MKKCKTCGITKPLTDFNKQGESKKTGKQWYRGRCKKCHNARFQPATGKPNTGRFKKGCVGYTKKGRIPWNKGKKMPIEVIKKVIASRYRFAKGRHCLKAKHWQLKVFSRDEYICQRCNMTEGLVAHHIKPWNDYPGLRFDINNGLTLCNSCHSRLHSTGRILSDESRKRISDSNKGKSSWNKGKKMSEEHRKKLSESHMGQPAWNKGLSGFPAPIGSFKRGSIPWNKGKSLSDEHKRKLSVSGKKRRASDETRKKMSKSHKERHLLNKKN